MKQRISGAATTGVLYESDWDSKTQSFTQGKAVNISDVLDKGDVSSIQISPYGITFKVVNKGKTTRYSFPQGIDSTTDYNLHSQLQGI